MVVKRFVMVDVMKVILVMVVVVLVMVWHRWQFGYCHGEKCCVIASSGSLVLKIEVLVV